MELKCRLESLEVKNDGGVFAIFSNRITCESYEVEVTPILDSKNIVLENTSLVNFTSKIEETDFLVQKSNNGVYALTGDSKSDFGYFLSEFTSIEEEEKDFQKFDHIEEFYQSMFDIIL